MTQKLQNSYTKELPTLLRKFSDSQQISQPEHLAKGLRTQREFDFGDQWDLITGMGKQTLGGHKQNLMPPGTRRKEQTHHKRLIQTSCECSGVSGRGKGRQWPAAGSGH